MPGLLRINIAENIRNNATNISNCVILNFTKICEAYLWPSTNQTLLYLNGLNILVVQQGLVEFCLMDFLQSMLKI
jgi:hypothetical protein